MKQTCLNIMDFIYKSQIVLKSYKSLIVGKWAKVKGKTGIVHAIAIINRVVHVIIMIPIRNRAVYVPVIL